MERSIKKMSKCFFFIPVIFKLAHSALHKVHLSAAMHVLLTGRWQVFLLPRCQQILWQLSAKIMISIFMLIVFTEVQQHWLPEDNLSLGVQSKLGQ